MGRILGPAAFKSRHKNAPRPAWKVTESYLQWLRGRPCYLAANRAGGCGDAEVPRRAPIEAAHVNHGGGGGMGEKAADRHAIPLCQRHHDEQHGKIGSFRNRGGWATFQLKYGFNAVTVAGQYWAEWLRTPMGKKCLAEGEDARG
jgi:hypothetical protein